MFHVGKMRDWLVGLPYFSLIAKCNSKLGSKSLGFGQGKRLMDHYLPLRLERFPIVNQ